MAIKSGEWQDSLQNGKKVKGIMEKLWHGGKAWGIMGKCLWKSGKVWELVGKAAEWWWDSLGNNGKIFVTMESLQIVRKVKIKENIG